MIRTRTAALVISALVIICGAAADASPHEQALRLLAPFSELPATDRGRRALALNYVVTGAIQTGSLVFTSLQSFTGQRIQALKDAVITGGNAAQLADGLGSTLGHAYQSRAVFISSDDGKTTSFSNISPAAALVIQQLAALSGADSAAAKFFFGHGTTQTTLLTSKSTTPMPGRNSLGGINDAYGGAYTCSAGSAGCDINGDSRPFQTERGFQKYVGLDYFGTPSANTDYLTGPAQDARKSPAFPSGHTTYAYTEALVLAFFVPERYPQMMTRAAEYGNNRIILGAHYAMDIIAGRTLALYDVAHALEPADRHRPFNSLNDAPNYAREIQTAAAQVRTALSAACGAAPAQCARNDAGRFRNEVADAAFYEATQTYALPVVYPNLARRTENVARLAPEAGYLLTTAFPQLRLRQADDILTRTEGPGGGFLDNGSAYGVYSRLDLYRAAQLAARVQLKQL